MQVVYLDILLLFNLYMNYMLVSLTARITHRKLRFRRALLGALLGALSALVFLLPELPLPLSFLYQSGTAVLICLVAFGTSGLCRTCICFFCMSFLLAGALTAVSMTGNSVIVQNHACYISNLSVPVLIILTIVIYGLLYLLQILHDRSHRTQGQYLVSVQYRQHAVQLEGLADTGNALVDFYTGKPVIICDKQLLGEMAKPAHSHPIPYMTVAGSGMLEVFEPDKIIIRQEQGESKSVNAVIGIGEQANRKAIFNPKLLYY